MQKKSNKEVKKAQIIIKVLFSQVNKDLPSAEQKHYIYNRFQK